MPMSEPAVELRELLSHILLEGPYDPDSLHREKFLIDHLVEKLEEWEIGDTSRSELEALFRSYLGNRFDLSAFIGRWVQSGEYLAEEDD